MSAALLPPPPSDHGAEAEGPGPGDVVVLASDSLVVTLVGLGAATHRVQVADGHGGWVDVHLALPAAAERADRSRNPHLGSTVGRYANRIGGARFPLDGVSVRLAANSGPNQLHGGPDAFDRLLWTLLEVVDGGGSGGSGGSNGSGGSATFGLTSPAGDQGFPGALTATATYTVDADTLTIAYVATTDAPTVVNLCHHSYWNLALPGPARRPGPPATDDWPTVEDHLLSVEAERVLPVDGDGLPLPGGLSAVVGTPFDLRSEVTVGSVLGLPPGGLDHSYAVDGEVGTLRIAGRLSSPSTGRWLTVETDQPALHVYTGNHLHGPAWRPHQAVSLEPQRFPDTPNRPDLGSARLDPGDSYRATTRYRFGATG